MASVESGGARLVPDAVISTDLTPARSESNDSGCLRSASTTSAPFARSSSGSVKRPARRMGELDSGLTTALTRSPLASRALATCPPSDPVAPTIKYMRLLLRGVGLHGNGLHGNGLHR